MHIEFRKGEWEQHFQYAYSWRFPETPKFIQEDDCIVNGSCNPLRQNGCDVTSILLKETYTAGATLSFTASFAYYGAPLVIIADGLEQDDQGNLRFGHYQEVVLWENGVNVWDIQKNGDGFQYKWLLRNDFPLKPNQIHSLSVRLEENRLDILAGGHHCTLYIPNLPKTAYLGITACEGINRFYTLDIEP